MEKDKFAEPLARETKLKKLEEDYTIILYKIIRYIIEELGQSTERQTIPFDYFNHWRKYSTKISIPKETAIEFGYGNDKFIEVRGTVNRKFHIYEERLNECGPAKQLEFRSFY